MLLKEILKKDGTREKKGHVNETIMIEKGGPILNGAVIGYGMLLEEKDHTVKREKRDSETMGHPTKGGGRKGGKEGKKP